MVILRGNISLYLFTGCCASPQAIDMAIIDAFIYIAAETQCEAFIYDIHGRWLYLSDVRFHFVTTI